MRLAVVLASLTVAVAIQSVSAADPPEATATPGKVAPEAAQAPVPASTTDSHPATATATSAPATAAATTAAAEDSDLARLEQRMHARGYTTRMENGEKVFCRREQVLGSRLGGALHCMHPDEARANLIQNDEEQLRQRMMMGCVPSHTANGQPVANCGS